MNSHKFVFPIEVYDREFDSKLLVSLIILAQLPNTEIIIGYDKHITKILLKKSFSCVLLDKSCSSIMYQSRIKPVIMANGKAAICDEEGVNNITNNYDGLLARFDPRSVNSIDRYFTWGKLDRKLAMKANIDESKIVVSGSPRLDLLNPQGKSFYSRKVNSLKDLFSDFVLFNENFCIETYDPAYVPNIRPHLSKENMDKLIDVRKSKREHSKAERESFAKELLSLVQANPSQSFVIRPHPMSDPKYWYINFGRYRNVNIIYQGPVEPWLIACKSLVSCGCTTALQAALAKKPVYHFSASNQSYSNSLAQYVGIPFSKNNVAKRYPEDIINKNFNFAKKVFAIDHTVLSASIMANELTKLSMNVPDSLSIKEHQANWNNNIVFEIPKEPKWRPRPLTKKEVTDKIKAMVKSYGLPISSLKIQKFTPSVILLTNA